MAAKRARTTASAPARQESSSLSARNAAAVFDGRPAHAASSSSASTPPAPAANTDCACPICLDTIRNAFMTKCGHSFCFQCITTHLDSRKSCPTCASPLLETEIYPNYSLNSVISNTVDSPNTTKLSFDFSSSSHLETGGTANLELMRARESMAEDGIGSSSKQAAGLKEIDSMLLSLMEKRKQLESNDKEIQLELMSRFLKRTKDEKEKELEALRQSMSFLTQDLSTITAELEKTRASHPTTYSKDKKAGPGSSSGVDTHNVPSTPRAGPTSAVAKRLDESVCSSPLPPELHGVSTPPVMTWGIGSAVSAMTGSLSDALSKGKQSRKRNHDEIDETEEPPQPPLEFIPDPPSTEPTDPLSMLLKSRMARLDPHFHELQQNYFAWRQLQPPAPTLIDLTPSMTTSTPTKNPATPASSTSNLLARSTTASLHPFSTSLSRISKISAFRTLARINYADKLVAGNGASTAPGANNTGSSSIVSAIEFDRDDEYFATAGVTKKIKIYEFESVVKDWGDV
ncbi:coatomer subunit alpha, partial [Podochytrium sp. JEL0797]